MDVVWKQRKKELYNVLLCMIISLFLVHPLVVSAEDEIISWEKDCSITAYATDPNCIFPVESQLALAGFNCANVESAMVVKKGEELHGFISINNETDIETTFTCRNCATGANLRQISNSMAELTWNAFAEGPTRFQIIVSSPVNQGTEKILYGAFCAYVAEAAQTPQSGATGEVVSTTTLSKYADQLNKLEADSLPELIGTLIKGLMGVIGTVALVMMLYGGITWMTARGNSESTTKARDTILWAGLGIILIFASYALVNFVFEIFR